LRGARHKLIQGFLFHTAIPLCPARRAKKSVAQTSKSAVSRVSNPRAIQHFARCRFGNRRYSRFGNLRYESSGANRDAVRSPSPRPSPRGRGRSDRCRWRIWTVPLHHPRCSPSRQKRHGYWRRSLLPKLANDSPSPGGEGWSEGERLYTLSFAPGAWLFVNDTSVQGAVAR
jgi:hypothetical protein